MKGKRGGFIIKMLNFYGYNLGKLFYRVDSDMMFRRFIYLILLAFSVFCGQMRLAEAMGLTEYMYFNASRGNLAAIQTYLRRGYNIDAPDSHGMTALCYAAYRQDIKAYQGLKRLGASDKKDCMRHLATRQADTKRYVRRQPMANSEPIVAVSRNDNTVKYAAIGLAAAGAATAAVLLSHHGGHSHHYTPTPDPDVHNCPTGQKWDGTECVDIVCPTGQHLEGNVCVPDASTDCPTGQRWNGTMCAPIECPTGQHLEGNTCVNNDECPTGQRWNGSQCVAIECEEGTHLEGDACVPDEPQDCPIGQRKVGDECVPIECPTNTHLVGNYCVADDVDTADYTNNPLYGVYSNKEKIYNLYSSPKYPDDEASITLKKEGNGDVYGMYGYGGETEVFNAYVIGKDGNGNVNKKPSGVANISITDEGDGTVYGMYSHISDITQYKEAINASGWNEGTATGNIDINHTGGGATYGILGDVRAYNTFIAQMGKGYGNINIIGDDDIYGISGYVAATNVVNYWFGDYGEGNINLTQLGNGDVYGMMINKDDVPGAGGTGQSWFAFNAYVGVGGGAFGNIDIRNYGNGNTYGMYGGQQLYNAKSFAGLDESGNPSAHPQGRINILNVGNGNSYGMYLPDEDDHGLIDNSGDNGETSIVNIVNVGSGTATGLRGGKKTTIINSGEISINNIGNGTAIGIYGEQNSNIINSGLINIYRTDYYDRGTVYTPSSAIGGTAYGIYAESGATVENSGDIEISGAANGKGIYIAPGATLKNTGRVIFNGVEQDKGVGATSVDLQSFGGGQVILENGGQFFADKLSGNLAVSVQSTLGSTDNSYNLGNALQVNDADDLQLSSQSAMFKASKVQNGTGYDVVLERNSFNSLIDNESLAQFFELNYEEGNNTELYDTLKTQATKPQLAGVAATVSGDNIIPSFRREDAEVYNHLSRQFNDNLFNHPDEKYIGGYKYIDISRDHDGTLEGNDGQVHVAYGMLKNKANNGVTYGIGATVSQLKSEYDGGSKRRNNTFGLWAPIGYNFGGNTQLVSKFYAGYSDGNYDRKSLGNKYSADIKSYQYGLSNEVRHNIAFGSGFKFIPTAELNLLGMHQNGFNEGYQNNALKVESSDSLSLEGGLGAYLAKEFMLGDNNKLGVQIGGIYYVEFLDPDDGVNATMRGMNHKYKLYHNFDDERAVFSARVNYNYKNITLYGLIEKELGGYEAFNIDAGLQYNFN